jgi:N6-adenosine-specific RNA methylase IME4
MKVIKNEHYELLKQEVDDAIKEAVCNSRWDLVVGYWTVGRLLREYSPKGELTDLLTALSVDLGVSGRTLWRALSCYDAYPDLDLIPEGKNISWNKLITKYLPKPKEERFSPPLVVGRFNVIYADPPWDIGSFVLEKWESPLEDKYPTMTEIELMNLDIRSISAEDCVIFLWSTLSTLPQALALLGHWEFKYHITITWDKVGGWSSCGFHRKTELLLVGYKGILSNVVKQEGEYIPTVFTENKREHSRKPEAMYKFIENRTLGTKVELFARTRREGWEVWGNEV